MMSTSIGGPRAIAAALALVAAGVAGCASSAPPKAASSGPTLHRVAALHDKLPAAVRASGTLRVVTDASYAPASSFGPDGRTIVGFEPDLGAALGKILGVRVTFVNHDFDTLAGIIGSGQADLIMSAMTDTPDREKKLDFVDYFSAGTSLVVRRGNPHSVGDLSSLCGQTVAVEKGTVQADLLAREQQHCAATPIKLLFTRTNDDALLALRTGRAAVVPMDVPPAEALASDEHTSDLYQLATTAQYEPGPYGVGVVKGQPQLRDAVRAALTLLMRDGVYRSVLEKWHVESGALHTATVNAAGGVGKTN